MPKVVALTGATGFIGAAVKCRLLEAGCQVRALYRGSCPSTGTQNHNLVWVRGGLDDPDSLAELLAGTTAVIHCAGVVRGACEAQFNQVNVDGVAQLVHAARQTHPWPRFLLLSSLTAREPQLSPYASSKRQGEKVLAVLSNGLPWIVLRPPAVYGPGDREIAPLFRWMARGMAPLIAPPLARVSMIFVQDLADAVIALLQQPIWKGQRYELHDGHPNGYCWQEIIDTVAGVLGRPVHGIRVPRPVLRAAAVVNLAASRLWGHAPMLTPGKVRELTHLDWTGDNRLLSRETGWVPRTGLAEGIRQTLAFLALGGEQKACLN